MDNNFKSRSKSGNLGAFAVESEKVNVNPDTSAFGSGDVSVVHIKVSGTIDLLTSSEFQTYVLSLIEKGDRNFIFDLAKLDFIDSMGLSTIIMLYQKISDSGGKLAIANPKPSIMVVFKVTKITQRIPVLSSLGETAPHFKR